MSYEDARAESDLLNAEMLAAGDALQLFPRGPTGIAPDAIKTTPQFRAAKKRFDVAFAALRKFNAVYVKKFAKELRAERSARYAQRTAK